MIYRALITAVLLWFGIYYALTVYHLVNLYSEMRLLEKQIEGYKTGYILYRSRLLNLEDFLKSAR